MLLEATRKHKIDEWETFLFLITLKFCLHLLAIESRMIPLTIAAASCQPTKLAGDAHHSSGWEIELRLGRGSVSKDECIVKRSAKIG
jgi:hypothetical protein